MDINKITEYQKKINSLMGRYEEITRNLLECPVDDVLMMTQKRQGLSEEMTAYDNQIRLECKDDPEVLDVYLNKCERKDLREELSEMFDLRQEFNSIAFRVKTMDPEIKERIILMREEIISKIKENNSSQNAKVAKYAQVGMPESDKMFFPQNKKMI